ncbi:MAG: sigma-70 domain-containing protein [Lachnospiraceae bacterium]|nr:sigma-70 domain-containing protein [Lachnospiraceae bacterium]
MMNEAVRNDLIEEFMPLVREIAAEYAEGPDAEEDLFQEGCIGLLKGIDALQEEENEWGGLSVDETVRAAVRAAIEEARNTEQELGRTDLRLVAQVEKLNESIDRLTEELGSKPNIDELANDMQIPQEKVIRILKLASGEVDEDALHDGASEK